MFDYSNIIKWEFMGILQNYLSNRGFVYTGFDFVTDKDNCLYYYLSAFFLQKYLQESIDVNRKILIESK